MASSSSMSLYFPIIVLSAPGALIALATIALHQFKVFFVAFVSAASETRGNALWQAAQPSLENIARVMEQTLGRAAGFNPNTTHVLLTALTLAVIICAERIRSAMFEAAKKHGDRMERIGR